MNSPISRRSALQAMAPATLTDSKFAREAAPRPQGAASPEGWCPEGPNTPKIGVEISLHPSAADMRRLKQIGINHVLTFGSSLPWNAEQLIALRDTLRSGGLTLAHKLMSIDDYQNTVYGRPGRDEEIEKIRQSIRAAGRAGIPVVEYTFVAHRLVEGYFGLTGRAGAGLTGYDYQRAEDLPPLASEGVHDADQMWSNVTYFLKAVVPVAEEAGVRLALHPNDPPAPRSRGSAQIFGSVEGWKRLIEIVPSKSNGIVFDCGVTREMGHDPVEVCRYFGSRDRINHVHYRNVRVQTPYEEYTEVFIDEGQANMFAVMKELVRQKYPRLVYPEHSRGLDVDRDITLVQPYYPGGGGYVGYVFNVGYARAMLQAALVTG